MSYFIFVIIFILAISLIYAWLSLAPWVPTPKKDLKRISDLADLKAGETFLDMGCGDGRVCFYMAKKNPEAMIVGVELALFFYLIAKIRAFFSGSKNLKIVFGNALKYDLSEVDVMYTFALIDTLNKKMRQKLTEEMKSGDKFISYTFSFKGWEGEMRTYQDHEKEPPIHVYRRG